MKLTIDVFNKIANKNIETIDNFNSGLNYYKIEKFKVSEKQLNWLIGTYIKEANIYADISRLRISVTDEEGNEYCFSHLSKTHNVPHYIPNREQYGCFYVIKKWTKLN